MALGSWSCSGVQVLFDGCSYSGWAARRDPLLVLRLMARYLLCSKEKRVVRETQVLGRRLSPGSKSNMMGEGGDTTPIAFERIHQEGLTGLGLGAENLGLLSMLPSMLEE